MSGLPVGACREILLRLPAETLFKLRAVCKGLRAAIDDPGFVKAHTNNNNNNNNQLSSSTLFLRNTTGAPFQPLYLFDPEALNFTNGLQTIHVTPLKLTRTALLSLPPFPVTACNGLMLLFPSRREDCFESHDWDKKGILEIRNLLTQERLQLPQPELNMEMMVGYGLGYDCIADDYKVVLRDYRKSQTHVYSLKMGSWRNIGEFPNESEISSVEGVFVNGALHWMSEGRHVIISFDLGTESYSQLQLPLLLKSRLKHTRLDALCGCLVLSCNGFDDNRKQYFDGWLMNDYGVQDSWMKLYSFNHGHACSMDYRVRPLAYMKNKKQVVLQHKYGFFLFDVESNSMKEVSIHGFSGNFTAQVCVGSLFRLHDNCGSVAAKRKKRKRKTKMSETKLTFCVRDYIEKDPHKYPSHDNCYSSDSDCPSGEGDDQ